MAKYAEFGSTPLPTDQVTDEDLAASQPSEFTRGARAGTYGMGSSLRNAIGAAADAFDFDNFAAQQYGEADRLAQRAQETGPRIGSLDQLGREGYSLRNMGDYAAGVMGGAAPSIGLGLGASLATGGALVPSLLAGTAAFTPFEAGDAVAKWRKANPGQQIDGQTGLRLGATGVGSAAFQSMVPAAVGGKIMGRGLASAPATSLRQAVGRNLAEIPMEGFTEGAGEFIKQAGATPGAPTDWGQVGENALAGMIGGAPMAGLGAAGDYVHGNSQAIGGAVDKGVGAVKGLAGRAAAPMRDAADAAGPVMRDAWDGVADMARAAYDGTVEGFKASDLGKTLGERAATVRDWAKEIIDDPATPETVREGLRSAVASAGNKASQAYVWAAKQARDAQTAVQEKGVKNAAADALRKLREKTDDTVDRVMNDDFLGDAAAMAKATGDRVTELSQESGRKAAEYAAKWGDELLNRAGVSEETKAQVAEAMRNVGDRANQATIAAAKKATDATEGVRKRAKSFVDGVKKGMRDARRADVDVEAREIPDPAGLLEGPKKSEDYSGARQAVNDVLAKYRQELPEAVLTDPETASMVADGLQQFVRIAARPGAFDTIDKHWVRAQLGSLLGPRSTDILNDVWDAIGSSDPDAVARRYATLNDLKDMNDQAMSLTQVLISALPEGSPLAARQAEDAEVLMQWARGQLTKGMPEEQIKFEDRRMQEYIRDTYGEHAEAVMVALEQRANQSRDMQHQRAVSDDVEGEIDEFDGSVNIRDADAPDTSYVGGNKSGKVLVQDPAVHRANNTDGREGPTERLIKKLQNDNPGADVRFVSIVDKPELVDMIPSLKTKITKQKKALAEQYPGDVERQLAALEQFRDKMVADLKADGRGMVEVTQSGNPDALTQADLEAMRLDTERYGKADHPARLEVKDAEGKIEHIFDAVAVARVMRGKINRDRTWTVEDDRSDAHRLARAFSDGVAALMEKFGHFKVPPTTLIGRINGKNFTAGDIKSLKKDDKGDNRGFSLQEHETSQQMQAKLDKLVMEADSREAAGEHPDDLDRLYARIRRLEREIERVAMEENADDIAQELGQQNVDPANDNIVKAGAALPARELQRPPQSGTANRKPPDAKPLIALAEKIRDSNAPAREKIADRLQTLALNIAMLSRKDQERLLDLKMAKKVSEVSGTINDLARKYADRIAAAGGADVSGSEVLNREKTPERGAMSNARAATVRRRNKDGVFGEKVMTDAELRARISSVKKSTAEWAGALKAADKDIAFLQELDPAIRESEEKDLVDPELAVLERELASRTEGQPRPKAAAAKKAAFLKKAASGDAALIKELKASNDAKGLQRAVEALNAAELTDANEANIIAAVETINARLTQLVQDPDVRYGMGTKKYSLRGLESRVDSQSDILRQTASASDETHALEQDVQVLGAKLGALRASGVKKEEVFGKPVLSSLMAALAAKRLQGDNYALTLMRAVLNAVDQVYAQPLDAALEQRMNKQIDDAGAYGVRLGDLLDEYRSASLPLGTKVIARAVKKVAGDVAVSRATGAVGADGFFKFSTGKIFVSETPSVGVASLVLHEGVHAATVAGVMKDKALQQALYDLLDHVVKENPRLASAYGAMNSFEFLAEGLSNVGLQDHLKQIKASDKVRKYLGETVATAWDAFVKLVRQAMGLSPAHESALSQLLDLSGRAMKATGQKGDVRVGQDDVDSTRKSGVVDPAETKTVVKEILAALGVKKSDPRNEAITKDAMGQLVQPNGKLSHADAISVRAAKLLLDEPQSEATGLTDSELAKNLVEYVREVTKSLSPASTLPSKLSTQIHNDLKRPGFAATHDSPHRHGGWFNWRKFIGRGEGNAAFGAGTYLSTADGVHRSYKDQFTAQARKDGRKFTWDGVEYTLQEDEDYKEWIEHIERSDGEVMSPTEEALAHEILTNGRSPEEAVNALADSAFAVVDRSARDLVDLMDVSLPSSDFQEAADALAAKMFAREHLTVKDVGEFFSRWVKVDRWNRMVDRANERMEAIRNLDTSGIRVAYIHNSSPTYEVSVNIKPEELLDWDKPLSEQSELVRKALAGTRVSFLDESLVGKGELNGQKIVRTWTDGGNALHILADGTYMFDPWDGGPEKISAEAAESMYDPTGEQIYDSLVGSARGGKVTFGYGERLGSQAKASDYLQSLGILGHKYAASGGKNDTHPNYVIYDDSKITTNYVHFSTQRAAGAGMSAKGQQQILDAIKTMLGNSVKVEFKNLPHAGEFEQVGVDDVIRISVHALNPTTVAYHESLHAFFAKLMRSGNGDIADVLMRATQRPAVAARLRELLAGEPAALRQLRNPEERAAYMFQFWASGDAKLGAALKGEPQNLLQRIAATLRKVLGIWSNEERALHIMQAFTDGVYAQNLGTPNAFHRAMMEPGRNKAIEAARSLTKPLAELGDVVVSAGSARLRESRIPSLVELADAIKMPLTEETGDPGFVPAARLERTRVLNKLGAKLGGLGKDGAAEVLEMLQTGTPGATLEVRTAAHEVKIALRAQYDYLRAAGVGVKDLGPDYFPRVYDATYISKHQDEFRALLDKYGVPDDTMHKIIANGGTELGVEVDRPGMQAKKRRKLDMIPDAELAPFMQKDLYQILNNYVTQATRRAEWARRFGDDSTRLHRLLAQARQEGATAAQIDAAEKYVKGVNGTLGDDINPTARRLMGDMIVYQNIRLLPLAIFSSVVDPMGVLVRGGEVKDAWTTFKRGIREIPKGLRGDTSQDQMTQLADMLGVIDNAALVQDLGAQYSQGMVGDTARKINDGFFRFNLMEQFNRSMRVGATEAALKFMQKHSTGNASAHSARWMRELGLMRGDVQVVNGRVALTQADGLTAAQEARIRTAVNRWVDGAVLRPDAADKPIWMNDPAWALVAHLKQFVYAFHHTILKRVGHEMRNGNYAPAMALASYVPIMIASDMAKGMLQNGGDEPEWKKNWGLEDYVAHGVQRAGLLGIGQLGVDAYTDMQRGGTGVGALAGPTLEQMGDALQVMGGHKQFGPFALRAMPANALYSGYLDEERADLSTD